MKEYYSRQARLFLTVGAIMLGLGVVGAAMFPHPPVIVLVSAVFPLLLGFSFKSTPIVRILGDRIEIKAGPLAKRKIVSFGEIERVIASDPRTVVLMTARGRFVVPTFAVEDYQRQEIIQLLGGVG